MKVWITKYALTTGVYSAEGTSSASHPEMFVIPGEGGAGYRTYDQYFLKPDWHNTHEEAMLRAETLREKKMRSLKAAIKELEEMEFTDMVVFLVYIHDGNADLLRPRVFKDFESAEKYSNGLVRMVDRRETVKIVAVPYYE